MGASQGVVGTGHTQLSRQLRQRLLVLDDQLGLAELLFKSRIGGRQLGSILLQEKQSKVYL